jgi:multiple sugar transport system substrate-binding protein
MGEKNGSSHWRRKGAAACAVAGVLLCCLATSGCIQTYAAGKERVTIRSSYWGAVEDIKVWEELARRFHRKQDRIRVKLEHIAGQNYHAKLMAMAVGRCAPDVMASDDEPFQHLAANGLFEDLGPWLRATNDQRPTTNDQRPMADDSSSSTVRLADLYTPFRETFVRNGRQYGLPYIGHCMLIFYNRDHRRAAGLPPDPDPDWTWEDLTRDAVALTRDLDGDGRTDQFGFNRLSWFYCLQWIWGAGGRDMDLGMTRYLFESPEARRGFQYHYDHMHRYRVCPMVSDLPNMTWDSMFLTGKVSQFATGSWWLAHCRTAKNIDWDVAPMPRGPVTRATRTTTEALTISAASPHKAEAWEWVKFVLSEEAQPLFAEHGRGIPALRRAARRSFPRPDTPQHEERFLEAMDTYARRSSIHERWNETARVFDREWDRVMLGRQTIDQFVRAAVPEADAIVRGEER